MTPRDLSTLAAKQARTDAAYHRVRGRADLAAHCLQDADLFDRIAALIDQGLTHGGNSPEQT